MTIYNILKMIPSAETVIVLRDSMGLTQTQLVNLMGLESSPRPWGFFQYTSDCFRTDSLQLSALHILHSIKNFH
ncbi:hypothetical protein SCTVLC_0234 [Serratia symbiotica SCt-VLC]|uniref:Uncharacterized protein n=1 Tax=Serratia symbiotica SCt-VLC TaxID=1347341 RepID=A0A068R9N5_9GAMM|nr:hypothetical protein SCTVLC_0234 [Serratia symbiotica SCt-VLC]